MEHWSVDDYKNFTNSKIKKTKHFLINYKAKITRPNQTQNKTNKVKLYRIL